MYGGYQPYANSPGYYSPYNYASTPTLPMLNPYQMDNQFYPNPDPYSASQSLTSRILKPKQPAEEEDFDQEGVLYMMTKQKMLMENFAIQLKSQRNDDYHRETAKLLTKIDKLEHNSNKRQNQFFNDLKRFDEHEKTKGTITNRAMRLYNDQKYDDEFMDELFQNPKFMNKVQEKMGGYMPRDRPDPYGFRDDGRGYRTDRGNPQRYGMNRDPNPPLRRDDRVRLPTLVAMDNEPPRRGDKKSTKMIEREDDDAISRTSRDRKKTMTKSMKF